MDTPPRPRNFFQYLAIGMCHFRRLWNGMCNRHRVEISVMQFTGHSNLVHHFVVARWDLHLVPYCQPSLPTRSLPITGHWDESLPPFLEWHVWSSSSGNNCHAVHRSLSSGASLCDGTVRFFTLSHIVSQAVFYSWIPAQVRLKTKNTELDTSLLNTQHYKVRIKCIAPSSTLRCTSDWKGKLSNNTWLRSAYFINSTDHQNFKT